MNAYHKQAEDFLGKHIIKVTVKNGGLRIPAWETEKLEHHTAIFRFSRKGKAAAQCTLHMSLADTYEYVSGRANWGLSRTDTIIPWKAPHPYDILSCLEKYEPQAFDDWVKEFCLDEVPKGVGFVEHYKNVQSTYRQVKRQWKQVSRFFTESEIQELQEIN